MCQGPPYASVMKPCRSGRSRHGEATALQLQPRHQCSPAPAPSRRTRAAETQGEPWRNIVAQTSTPQPLPPRTPTASPSPETVVAVEELGRRSGEHLSTSQHKQLRHLLRDFVDIFAAREEDYTRTALVQHNIDTGHRFVILGPTSWAPSSHWGPTTLASPGCWTSASQRVRWQGGWRSSKSMTLRFSTDQGDNMPTLTPSPDAHVSLMSVGTAVVRRKEDWGHHRQQ